MDQNIPQGSLPQQVNVYNPEGDLVSIPAAQMSEASDMGYVPASPEEVHAYGLEQKYGGAGQTAKAFLEGAGKGATFGLSTGLEKASGAKPEDIRGRREANPIAHAVGEMAGLVGSAFIPGLGEANILSKAGGAGAKALGLAGEGALSRVGSAAVKGAIETALVQGGDEVSKMFSEDPRQSAQTALVDIGLAGLLGGGIGGAFGTVAPLWKATTGGKFGEYLDAIKRRADGEAVALPKPIESALAKTELEIAPEIRTALSGDPEFQRMFAQLQESTEKPGLAAQQSLKDFRKNASDTLVKAFGKTPEDMPSLATLSDYEAGQGLQKQIATSVAEKIEPLTKQFENIKAQFSDIPLTVEAKTKIADDLAQIAQKQGLMLTPDSPQLAWINKAQGYINNAKSLEDIRKINSIIGKETFDKLDTKGLNFIGGQINKTLRSVEDDLIEQAAGFKSPQLVAEIQEARASYRAAMDTLEQLNDRLRVGNYGGGTSFINAMKDMAPEDVLRRLSSKNDAGVIGLLSDNFPEVASSLRGHQINKLLASAAAKAPEGHAINAKALFREIDKMSPETRSYILGQGVGERAEAIKTLLNALPEKMNTSGTAKTLDSLWSKVPGGALAIASLLTGHNPIAGYLIGQAGRWLSRSAPDAVRLAMLKFLGHSGPVEPAAFKAMVDYIQSTVRGENILSKGIKNMFKAGAEVLPRSQLPDENDRKRLDKTLMNLMIDSSPLPAMWGDTSYYLPEHGGAFGETAAGAVNYLNSLRPSTAPMGPLDPPKKPSDFEVAKFNRALDIAQQPMVLLESVKAGSVTPQDVHTLKTLYPGLYSRMSQKMLNEIVDVKAKGETLNYNTVLGMSMFMGQALDSSIQPQVIMANQMSGPSAQQAPSGMPQGKVPHKVEKLDKLYVDYQTPNQARVASKLKG